MFKPRPPPDAVTFWLADQLRKLVVHPDIEVFGPQIVRIFEGAGMHRFIEIDEREEYWHWLDGRFHMVRQVRNHPDWAPRLFASLKAPSHH